MCPPTLLQMLAQPRCMSSISSILQPAKHVTLFMRHHAIESKIIRRFFYIMLAQFRRIVSKPRRQHVWTHGYTVMEQPVARDLFQSLAAGIMLVERQQSSDNSLCSYPVASNTSQPGITCHKLQKRQALAPSSKPNFEPKNEAIFGFT